MTDEALEPRAALVDPAPAAPWPEAAPPGDTVWLAAVDAQGRAVSFIQSIYWEFVSGVVFPETGLPWQNRGPSCHLHDGPPNRPMPGPPRRANRASGKPTR